MMAKHTLSQALVTLLFPLSGCATAASQTNGVSTAVDNLNSATASLQAAAKTESDAKVTVRRDEAVRYWLAHLNDTTGTNLNSSDTDGSFERFVCAGQGALTKDKANIAYLTAYASGAKAAIAPGPDTFSGQFEKFRDQNSAQTPIKLPGAIIAPDANNHPTAQLEKASARFGTCVAHVKGLLAEYNTGVPATDQGDEFALAVIPVVFEAAKALVNSLGALAKDGLKAMNAAQQREHLKKYVELNDNNLNQVLADLKSANKLDAAWARREEFVIGNAYDEFVLMLTAKNPDLHRASVRAAGLKISSDLAAFDAMENTRKPSDLITEWADAQAKLKIALADKTVSIDAIVSFLQSLSDDIASTQKDYQDSADKFSALVTALSGKSK